MSEKQKYIFTRRYEFEAIDDAQARQYAKVLLGLSPDQSVVVPDVDRKDLRWAYDTKLQRLKAGAPPEKVEL